MMDGLALMRLISEQAPNAGVVVLSSGERERELLAAVQWLAREQRINLVSVISKPASRKALESALHHPARRPKMAATPIPPLSYEEISVGSAASQFEAFVQPKVRFADGKLVGAEALARWRHPQRGWITPAAFIDRIEASPLIEPFSLAIPESVANTNLSAALENLARLRMGGYCTLSGRFRNRVFFAATPGEFARQRTQAGPQLCQRH